MALGINGPAARLLDAQSKFLAAQRSGNPVQQVDAQAGLMRAARALERLEAKLKVQLPAPVANALRQARQQAPRRDPDFGQRLMQTVASSRIGAGGGLMPLIGELGSLVGGAAGGPIGLALTVATSALKGFSEAVRVASEGLASFRDAKTLSGGTTQQVASLTALGLPQGDITGLASSIRERMSRDPFAMHAGMRLGVGVQLPEPFADPNKAGFLLKIVEGLEAVQDPTQRAILAHRAHAESLLPLLDLSEKVRKEMMADAKVMADISGDPGATQAAKDFQAELGRLGRNFQMLLQAGVKPLLPALADMTGKLATFFQMMAEAQNLQNRLQARVWEGVQAAVKEPWKAKDHLKKAQEESLQMIKDFASGAAAHNTAMQSHSAAMQAHADALKQGTFGGGSRAQGALPQHLRGWAFDKAVDGNAMRLGAFAF